MIEIQKMKTDVLIVGGGGAGAMAAIKATAAGADVLVVTKGPFPSGNTSIAAGGFGAALGNIDPRDNPQVHFEDAVKAGNGLSNQKLIRTWVTKIVEITNELDGWGIDLIRDGDKLNQRPWAGHTYPRMVHHHFKTGKAITKCLAEKTQQMGIKALENTAVGGLLKSGDEMTGAWSIDYKTGRLIFIQAKAVILATGGLGNLYPMTDNIGAITGEGYALAFRAGAELIQMEFCHFLPTPCYPEEMKTKSVYIRTLNELLQKGAARFYNNRGERFMKKYFPDTPEKKLGGEQMNKAIGMEVCRGNGGPHGGVYLDVSDIPPEMQQTLFSDVWEKAERAGVDLAYQPIEITTNPHDLVGGVKYDEKGRTNVPGLYVAGEASGGAHGAGRFGGSALAEALSFGAITGIDAAQLAANKVKQTAWDEKQAQQVQKKIKALMDKKEGIEPSSIQEDVQAIAYNYLNAGRSKEGLENALREVEHVGQEKLPQISARDRDQKKSIIKLRQAIEVDGQLELARIIATAALCREESRGSYFGGHYRIDYPEQDDDSWMKNIVLTKHKDGIAIHFEPPVVEN